MVVKAPRPDVPAATSEAPVVNACITSPHVDADRARRLEELKKQFPGVDFEIAQTGPVFRSMIKEKPSANPAAEEAARAANGSHSCDGMRIRVKPSP